MPKKRKPATRSATAPKKRVADSNVVKLVTFEITYDAVPDPQIERLPPEDQQRIAEVGERMFQNPENQVAELEELVATYPDIPLLYNYLMVAYRHAGRGEEATRVLHDTHERFPDYLFGRTNLAMGLLLSGRAREVPKLFGGTWDLTSIYPGRRTYHVSEAVAFYSVLAFYLAATGDDERARTIYDDILCELAPEDSLTQNVGDLFSSDPLLYLAARAKIRVAPRRRRSL